MRRRIVSPKEEEARQGQASQEEEEQEELDPIHFILIKHYIITCVVERELRNHPAIHRQKPSFPILSVS